MKVAARFAGLAVLGLVSVLALGGEVQKIYGFKGGVKVSPAAPVAKKDLAYIPPAGKNFSQSWTFVYYLDDGSGGYLQFSTLRLAYAFKQILVHHAYFPADGPLVYRKEILSTSEVKWEATEPRLTMNQSYWSGFYPEFRIFAPLNDLYANLTFQSLVPPWRPGDGPVHYFTPDGDWYDLVVPIPLAAVTGTIRVGSKEKKVSGFGYMDHNSQTVWFLTQVQELFALRSFGEKWSIHFLDYWPPPNFGNQRVSWLIVMKDNKIIYATDKYKVEPSDWVAEPKRGRKYPRKARVVVEDPQFKLVGEIKGVKLLDVLDVRDEVPAVLEPAASKLIRQPAFIRQRAEVTWKLTTPAGEETAPARGIFEYTIAEKE